jgi:GTPase KRas protein
VDGRTFTLEITGTLTTNLPTEKLTTLDTAGQEEYRGLWQSSNLQKADAYLLVYDITSPPSLEQLAYFDDLITMMTDESPSPVSKVKVIAGNKCDLASQRAVSSAEGLTWARTRGMGFMETSAKLKVNVEETFALIVRRVMEARKAASEQALRGAGTAVGEKVGEGQVAVSKNVEDKDLDRVGCQCCIIC